MTIEVDYYPFAKGRRNFAGKLLCDNGKDCPYGRTIEDDECLRGAISTPEEAYSQSGHTYYRGLCLNCLDDFNRDIESMSWD
jgi:hypothetical protein